MHPGTNARSELNAAVFRPPRALGVITGGAISAWALLLAIGAFAVAAGGPAEFKTFLAWAVGAVLLLVGLLFAYWAWALATLRYEVGRDALVIHWGLRRVEVPISNIQRMVPGRTVYEARVEGLNWWGCHIGHADVTRVGFTLFYSTHSSDDELLYVIAHGESYALTILDQAAFAEEIQANAALGGMIGSAQRSSSRGVAALPFWRDRTAIVLSLISIAAAVVTVGYVYAAYPGLPDVVQLDFPALEGIVRIGEKSELLRIAYVGAGVVALNTVAGVVLHARERAAGLWMFASSAMLQGVLLAAALTAFSRA